MPAEAYRKTESRLSTWGWRILVGLSGLLAFNGVGLYAFVETQQERTIGVLLAGFAVLALVVTLQGLRQRSRSAWNASWVLVATLGAIGVHMLRGDRVDLVAWYVGLAAVALVGQLLARKGMEP